MLIKLATVVNFSNILHAAFVLENALELNFYFTNNIKPNFERCTQLYTTVSTA